jgi:hypothetical protein
VVVLTTADHLHNTGGWISHAALKGNGHLPVELEAHHQRWLKPSIDLEMWFMRLVVSLPVIDLAGCESWGVGVGVGPIFCEMS